MAETAKTIGIIGGGQLGLMIVEQAHLLGARTVSYTHLQMSAWYVLSSLGFYQVEPAGGRYFFGSPLFDKAEVRVRDGVLTVTAHNNSALSKSGEPKK